MIEKQKLLDYILESYKKDMDTEIQKKCFLLISLEQENRNIIINKYKDKIKPEDFVFGIDYECTLLELTSLEELESFYDLTCSL